MPFSTAAWSSCSVRGDDASLEEIGPRVPSSASADFGRPFAEIFARYDHDFYRIDPLLFSPAVVTFLNQDTGTTLRFGETCAGSVGGVVWRGSAKPRAA